MGSKDAEEGKVVDVPRKSLWRHIRSKSSNTASIMSQRLLNVGTRREANDVQPNHSARNHKHNNTSDIRRSTSRNTGSTRKNRMKRWGRASKRSGNSIAQGGGGGESIRVFELSQARAEASRHNLMLRADSMRSRKESSNIPQADTTGWRLGSDDFESQLPSTNDLKRKQTDGKMNWKPVKATIPMVIVAFGTGAEDDSATEFASRRAIANTRGFGSSYCSFTDTELASLRGHDTATHRFDDDARDVDEQQFDSGRLNTRPPLNMPTHTHVQMHSRVRHALTNGSAAALTVASESSATALLKKSSSVVIEGIRKLTSKGAASASSVKRTISSDAGTVESPVFWYSGLAMALESENDRQINEEILKNFFLDHDPARVYEVDTLLDEYIGREEVLFEELQLQYPRSTLSSPSNSRRSESSFCSVTAVSNNESAAVPQTDETDDEEEKLKEAVAVPQRGSIATVLVASIHETPAGYGHASSKVSTDEKGAATTNVTRPRQPSFSTPKRSLPKMDGDERRGQDIPTAVGPYVDLDGERSTDYILSALALRTQNAKGPRRKWATNLQNNILRRHMLHAGATQVEADVLLRTLANGTFSARKAEMEGELQIKRRVRAVSGDSLPPEMWQQTSAPSLTSSSSSPFAPLRPLCEAVRRAANEELFDNDADLSSGIEGGGDAEFEFARLPPALANLSRCKRKMSRDCQRCTRVKGAHLVRKREKDGENDYDSGSDVSLHHNDDDDENRAVDVVLSVKSNNAHTIVS